MLGKGRGLPRESALPVSYLSGSRDSESTAATLRREASPHSRQTAAGSGYQESEHVAF
jgi:hypothetical protein